MAEPMKLRFLRSASAVDQLGDADVELALIGRSNVGKSSLINALANQNNLARTSKSPGATRLINVFEVGQADSGRWLVDLPGYGYAKVSHNERRKWQKMIEGYLIERESLRLALLLVDGEIGPTELDLGTAAWLGSIDLPFVPIATKSDKVKSSKRPRRKIELAEKLGVAKGDVSWVSSAKGHGVHELRQRITTLFEA